MEQEEEEEVGIYSGQEMRRIYHITGQNWIVFLVVSGRGHKGNSWETVIEAVPGMLQKDSIRRNSAKGSSFFLESRTII